MLQTFDPTVLAQMALGAIADLAFAFALGAALLGFGGAMRTLTIRAALVLLIVAQCGYLPLQASVMAGEPLADAFGAVPIVLVHSHFGAMWGLGMAGTALALSATAYTNQPTDAPTAAHRLAQIGLGAGLALLAFAHAATTHAADAGDGSAPELIHFVHLLATAAWSGAVMAAAGPLRHRLAAADARAPHHAKRLSQIATVTFALAIATGMFNAYRGLGGSLAALSAGAWGLLLATKLVTVAVVVTIGAINRAVYLPRVRAGRPEALTAFRRWLSAEAVLMGLALTAAAVLGHSVPAALG